MIKIYHKQEKREVRTSSWEFPTVMNLRSDFIGYTSKRFCFGIGIINYIMPGNRYPRLSAYLVRGYNGWRFHFGINNGLYQFTIAARGPWI